MKPINKEAQTATPNPLETSHAALHQAHLGPRWAALVGALAIGLLYLLLPDRLIIGPSWLLLVIEGILLLPLVVSALTNYKLPHHLLRMFGMILLGITTLALAIGIALLIQTLPGNIHATNLLRDAGLLWTFNILVFALWYFEIDGGGPLQRHLTGHKAEDFMFPQQAPGSTGELWVPQFLDYLFLAFTGATALSPADTYPLTRRAKLLMMIEAMLSLTIIVLLAARAVNILGQ